jgi:hypothetical protein
MGDELYICIDSCRSSNSSDTPPGNDSYDFVCITRCTQRITTLYNNTAEK